MDKDTLAAKLFSTAQSKKDSEKFLELLATVAKEDREYILNCLK